VSLFVADGKPCANPQSSTGRVSTRGRWAASEIISDLPEIGNIATRPRTTPFGSPNTTCIVLVRHLASCQNLGIEAELEYSVGPGGPRESFLPLFVDQEPKGLGFLDFEPEIRPPSPSPVFERPLIDHIRPERRAFVVPPPRRPARKCAGICHHFKLCQRLACANSFARAEFRALAGAPDSDRGKMAFLAFQPLRLAQARSGDGTRGS